MPRLDIGAPANAIEHHPFLLDSALLAQADDNAGDSVADYVMPVRPSTVKVPSPANIEANAASDIDLSDLSDDDLLSDDSVGSDDSDMSLGEKAEIEKFGDEYQGPKLPEESSSRLLLLMLHASTCPCRYVCVCRKVARIFGRKCHLQ
jgi:hypothetical protein